MQAKASATNLALLGEVTEGLFDFENYQVRSSLRAVSMTFSARDVLLLILFVSWVWACGLERGWRW